MSFFHKQIFVGHAHHIQVPVLDAGWRPSPHPQNLPPVSIIDEFIWWLTVSVDGALVGNLSKGQNVVDLVADEFGQMPKTNALF